MVTLHFDWPGGKKKECPKYSAGIYRHVNFSVNFRMIETILYVLASSLGFSDITLFWFSLPPSWHICILTLYLGGWGEVSPWRSQSLILFLFYPSSLVKCHDFCFCLIHVKPILYTQAPAGSIQNKRAMSLSYSKSFSSFLELHQQPLFSRGWVQEGW